MARTFIRQDNQVQSSDVFNDAIAPSEANFETNPLNIEEDLNNVRSMLHHLLKVQTGNWWDTITAPSTLEAGTQRGVDDLNNALHLVEKKRVLRDVCSLVDVTVPASVTATGSILTVAPGSYADAQTFALVDATGQSVTFEFDTVPNGVGGGNVAVDISAAADADAVRDAIISAVNGVAGTLLITAGNGGAATVSLTQDVGGSSGNTSIATTGGPPGTFNAFTGGTGDVVILGALELPSPTTAAVGSVTTLGTVVAAHTGTFGNVSLDEVAGANTVSPKNLMQITDAATHDPILSGGQIIYGLLQSENATNPHTITGNSPDRVQISFVRVETAGDDLELVPASDIAGKTIHYCTRERVRLEDLNEEDFLRGAVADLPQGTTVTRQVGYDNQGVTPVDLLTNAILDLEGPGLEWQIRDDAESLLFRIIEGSAGDTSEIEFGAEVDVFDNDAVVNDFLNGMRIDTGGQRIDIGETDGTIESTGANDLRILGAGELYLDDGNQDVSWAQTAGVKLSDTSQEWIDYETAFGGEVSLLNAIVQASQAVGLRTKVQATVTSTTVADTDVNGPILGGGQNVDVNLPAYDQVVFVDDVEVFYNGQLLRNGANAAANEDVYPGTTPSQGDLRFEFTIKAAPGQADVITVIVNGQ